MVQSAGARADGSTVSSTATNPSTMSGNGWLSRGAESPRISVHRATLVSPCTSAAIDGLTLAPRRSRIVISSITAATTTTSISTKMIRGGSEESTSCQLVIPSSTAVAKIGSQRRAALSFCITLSSKSVRGAVPREMGVTVLYPVPQRSGVAHGYRSGEGLADHLRSVDGRQDKLHHPCGSGVEQELHRGARLAGELAAARFPATRIGDERLLVDVLEDGLDRRERPLHQGSDTELSDHRVTDVVDRDVDLHPLGGCRSGRQRAADVRHRGACGCEEGRDDTKEEPEEHDADDDQEHGSRVGSQPAPHRCEHACQIVAGGWYSPKTDRSAPQMSPSVASARTASMIRGISVSSDAAAFLTATSADSTAPASRRARYPASRSACSAIARTSGRNSRGGSASSVSVYRFTPTITLSPAATARSVR